MTTTQHPAGVNAPALPAGNPGTPMPAERRGRYGEVLSLADGTAVLAILSHFQAALPASYAEFDRKGRGQAINQALYGYDASQDVAVIQVRHARRRYQKSFLTVHKSYVLCGFNEGTGLPFRHPVSAQAVRAAVRGGADAKGVVFAAQRWMWRVTPLQLTAGIRQGDVLLVPERCSPTGALTDLGGQTVVGGSHIVAARRIVRDGWGMVWADTPSLRHAKDQHDPVHAEHEGWHTVRLAREALAWDFAARLSD